MCHRFVPVRTCPPTAAAPGTGRGLGSRHRRCHLQHMSHDANSLPSRMGQETRDSHCFSFLSSQDFHEAPLEDLALWGSGWDILCLGAIILVLLQTRGHQSINLFLSLSAPSALQPFPVNTVEGRLQRRLGRPKGSFSRPPPQQEKDDTTQGRDWLLIPPAPSSGPWDIYYIPWYCSL